VSAHPRAGLRLGQPSLARRKIRRLELAAGAPSRKGQVPTGHGLRDKQIRDAERALAIQAENAYRRTSGQQPGRREGASVTPRRAKRALEGPTPARWIWFALVVGGRDGPA
jgi:hypothetical protein